MKEPSKNKHQELHYPKLKVSERDLPWEKKKNINTPQLPANTIKVHKILLQPNIANNAPTDPLSPSPNFLFYEAIRKVSLPVCLARKYITDQTRVPAGEIYHRQVQTY